jgi:predicted O-methyltransferase YrrM
MSGLVNHHRQIHRYLEGLYAPEEELIAEARRRSHEAGLPEIEVPPLVGKLLEMMSRLQNAERILEIGTLGGISGLHLLKGCAGSLTTLEKDPHHAEVAHANFAPLSNRVEQHVGDALSLLPTLTGPFDLIFLDADKENYPQYIEPMLTLSRPGTLILADNVLRKGKVLSPSKGDAQMQALARFNQLLSEDPRLEATILPTFGGYGGGSLDGVAMARVVNP